MTHLSTVENPWGKPFTNKRYVHPPYAENIITMWPTSMVLIGEITAKDPQGFRKVGPFDNGFAAALPSAGVGFVSCGACHRTETETDGHLYHRRPG